MHLMNLIILSNGDDNITNQSIVSSYIFTLDQMNKINRCPTNTQNVITGSDLGTRECPSLLYSVSIVVTVSILGDHMRSRFDLTVAFEIQFSMVRLNPHSLRAPSCTFTRGTCEWSPFYFCNVLMMLIIDST